MKNYLVLLSLAVLILASCKEDEEPVDPLVGVWVLEDVEVTGSNTDFARYYGSGSSVYGESSYVFTFNADLTYERELENLPVNGNQIIDSDDSGEWEKDDDELDLDIDESEVNGLDDSFIIEELTNENLILSYDIQLEALPDFIVQDEQVQDTVETQEQINALFDEYGELITLEYTLEFEKED